MSQELDLLSIDPWSLPFVELQDKENLPECGGIYFAIKARRVVYIGKSDSNLRQRWNGHHRFEWLNELGGVRLAYWRKPDEDTRTYLDIETQLISLFNPEINRMPTSVAELRKSYQESAIALELEKFKVRLHKLTKKAYVDSFSFAASMTTLNSLASVGGGEIGSGVNTSHFKDTLEDVAKDCRQLTSDVNELVKAYNAYVAKAQSIQEK